MLSNRGRRSRRPGRLALPVALVASCAAAAPAMADGPCAGGSLSAADDRDASVEAAIVCTINVARERRGLAPLRTDGRLERAASGHAADMVRRNYFSHVTPGGTTMLDRVRDSGYLAGAGRWAVGETLAWGRGRRGTAAAVVEAWFDSPPHRQVLLNRRYREIGVGAIAGLPFRSGSRGSTYAAELGVRR